MAHYCHRRKRRTTYVQRCQGGIHSATSVHCLLRIMAKKLALVSRWLAIREQSHLYVLASVSCGALLLPRTTKAGEGAGAHVQPERKLERFVAPSYIQRKIPPRLSRWADHLQQQGLRIDQEQMRVSLLASGSQAGGCWWATGLQKPDYAANDTESRRNSHQAHAGGLGLMSQQSRLAV